MLLRNQPDSPALDGILTVLLLLPFVLAVTTEFFKVAEDQNEQTIMALAQKCCPHQALKWLTSGVIDFLDRQLLNDEQKSYKVRQRYKV